MRLLHLNLKRFRDARTRSISSIHAPKSTMAAAPRAMSLTFLGTASAQPSATRNHSALALRLGADVWLFDCGEATQHQLQRSTLKMGRVKKVFITHTHGPSALRRVSYA
jgi:glyoxylase-like metal-dependent hydrolase (beta-lactamase superfamily II)